MEPEVSVVLVCYEMGREIPRTLFSLSPRYQRNCPPGRCQVILVDNGSAVAPRLEDFADLGLDLTVQNWPNPTRSPVAALNHGLSLAKAPIVGAWIDGARMASPGLIDACASAAKLHARPVVSTPNYHLGSALQYFAGETGYDQAAEDALLESIDWPVDGYRLFDIATSDMRGGDRGPLLESNAFFMTNEMWREHGGFEPGFTGSGGGIANPDAFIRACELPDAQLIRIRGEATFHQFHDGVSTGPRYGAETVLKRGGKEYFRIRKRPMGMVRMPGWLFDSATGAVDRG